MRQQKNELIPTNSLKRESEQVIENKDPAYNAMDKDMSTKMVTYVENGAAWFKVEFGEVEFIHEVIIFTRFYTDWYSPSSRCVNNIESFKSCMDDRNDVDVSVYQGDVQQKSCGTLQLTYGLERTDQIYTLLCNTEGDSVKLSKTTGTLIEVFEIVVTGKGLNF